MTDDALEIANLKARYCASADRCAHDPAGGRAAFTMMFTPDADADYGYGLLTGIPAIADFLAESIAGESEWMIHMLGSPRISVSGDEATGDWTIKIHSKRRSGSMMEVVGRYSDVFQYAAEGWKISHIRFRHYS
jgi:ketosteroid isomerase-like protein